MARQNSAPVQFNRTTRNDTAAVMTSGRAGKVVPVSFFPVLRGESVAGRFACDVNLAPMPKPLVNGCTLNVQAWFVPKTAHPQFPGYDEFLNSYQGEDIKSLGAADRTPPAFFTTVAGSNGNIENSEVYNALGLHTVGTKQINLDLIDAYNVIYNFRLAAHSSRLTRRDYWSEDFTTAATLARAFWPSSRFSRVVPDYERALVVGNLDLDVTAGQIPVEGFYMGGTSSGSAVAVSTHDGDVGQFGDPANNVSANYRDLFARQDTNLPGGTTSVELVFAEMAQQTIGTSLADIDKARVTQSFAKLRAAYAGNDATGFDNDDAIIAELMQGLSVPSDHLNRPWLLDSKRVPFGFVERHATDATNLDQSLSEGLTSAQLSLNIPMQEVGGVVIITVEVVPERFEERQSDPWIELTSPSQFPDALRDVQRIEPVDIVTNGRLDALHTSPDGVYGYEPMNDKWNRNFTRLGGQFYQATAASTFREARAAIWHHEIIDPVFSDTHYLCPADFPHDVFSDTLGDAFEITARHDVRIVGLTQFGDILNENNDDYDAISQA